jgi:hypothetical protein
MEECKTKEEFLEYFWLGALFEFFGVKSFISSQNVLSETTGWF